MEFRKVIVGLTQRKLLVLPLFAVAITLGIAGYFLTPLKYISSTTMVLVTPAFGGTLSQDPSQPTDLTNPLLNFNDNLKTASTILIYEMNTREVAAELGALDSPTKITVDDGRTNPKLLLNNGPFVYIVGESTSQTEAKDVVIRAQKRMRQELTDRQNGLNAPPETYVTLVDVVGPAVPEVSRADRIKVGGIASVLSFLVGLSAARAWQRLRAERPSRTEAEPSVQREGHESFRSWGEGFARRAESADADATSLMGVTMLPPEDDEVSLEKQVANAEQVSAEKQVINAEEGTGNAQVTDYYDQIFTGVRLAPDEARADEGDQSAEPELAAYPEEQVDAAVGWRLYFVDYPPTDGEHPAPGSANDQLDFPLDWDLDELNSQRISS